MKKVIVLLVVIITMCSSFFQNDRYFKFRTVCSQIIRKGDKGEIIKYEAWRKNSILIIADLQMNKLTIYAKKEQAFDLIKFFEPKKRPGEDWFFMEALDTEYGKCSIRQVTYSNTQREGGYEYTGAFYIDYKDITFVHRVVEE
jgi:hypothetical protein